MLVGARVAVHALERPDLVALDDGHEAVTWSQLTTLIDTVRSHAAQWPQAEGRTDVALIADWSPRFVALFVGLGLAGWGVGVLDPAWTTEEVIAAIDQLDPAAVVVDSELGREGPPGVGWGSGPRIVGADVWRRIDDASALGRPRSTPDSVFYVGFTSGSAGQPKAFARSHRSWCESFMRFDDYVPNVSRIVLPGTLSSSHFLFGLMHALHAGVTARLVRAREAVHLGALLAERDVPTAIYVVPTMLSALSEQSEGGGCVPAAVFCAGARLEQATLAAARAAMPATRIVEYYGASELSFVAIRRDGDGTPAGSVGQAFPGVEIAILDDDDRPLPPGANGVIAVRSDLVFAGYRGKVPPSGARALRDGWLTVGDRGRLDVDGHLWVAGRGSALVISGGVNVQPEEVEEVVASAEGVRACVVVGLPDARWGEIVCAAVVEDRPGMLRRADVRRRVDAALSRAKRPRRYVRWLGPLPIGRTGKVDRAQVREAILEGGHVEEIR